VAKACARGAAIPSNATVCAGPIRTTRSISAARGAMAEKAAAAMAPE
jgi:hypothetical protein